MKPSGPPAREGRVLSIDLLRGLDVWLMLFVNEVAGVAGAPAFLKHFEPRRTGDGMTITDIVFPAFLFIVGLAIPFALGNRRRRGEARAALWKHVLLRTLSLLAMGVMIVNADDASAAGLLSPPAWTILTVIAVVLAWQSPAPDAPPWMRFLRPLGWLLVAVAVLTFRSDAVASVVEIRPSWWGILGLIGWAYLVAAAIYLLAGDRAGVLVGGVALLYGLYLADEAGRSFTTAVEIVDVGRFLGAHAAVTLSGVVLGVMLVRQSGVNPYQALGSGSVAAGLVRSAVFAWIVIRLCGLLRAAGVRLQL
jgi:heparan-alpha-glucosaminide N-acetyltransferase